MEVSSVRNSMFQIKITVWRLQLLTASKSKRADLGHRSRARQRPLRENSLRLTNKVSIFK